MHSKIVGSPGNPAIPKQIANYDEAQACALIMSTSEPWLTLQRSYSASLAIITDPDRETYVVHENGEVVGFVTLTMHGGFVGYVQSVAVREDRRGRGIGQRLIAFAEDRIFRDSPNVFLCVSSFNTRARALYERRGYRIVGELTDYIVQGHSEIIMRKTIGSVGEFRIQ